MTIEQSRRSMEAAQLVLQTALEALGCPNPLVSVRVTDVDTAPEPGAYLDVACSARIPLPLS